ncbi:GAF and ANTAR domain-containing protein [Streptomyces sp. NPDC049813]|uniref:GAF and ANTAR domain-containing protein n=1 Tax=Streptomyces sp. NPDC049813 TaxID=3365597 RepID=UPI0037AA2182
MDWQLFAQQMATMARDLLAQSSEADTLERVTQSATELVEGCDAAGILHLHGTRVQTIAPTDQLVLDSHHLQEQLQEGPCFDAARDRDTTQVYRIADLTAQDRRWPRYAPQARELGIGSMMGFLLYTDKEQLGALNLYARRPAAFTHDSETAGWLLASHAAVALSGARAQTQMDQAVATRHTIGEAMGILRAAYHLSAEQAFDLLRRRSQRENTKLRDVAQLVCEHGRLP